jgi:hypothetical protein
MNVVITGLVPVIPLRKAMPCPVNRDCRVKFTAGPAEGPTRLPGNDKKQASFAARII